MRLWGWIAAAGSVLVAALLLITGQRDRAREAASRARAEAKSRAAAMEAEQAIDTARARAREKTADIQRKAEARPKGTRPEGTFRR